MEYISVPPSRCAHCLKMTTSYALCVPAKKELRLTHVWVASEYINVAKSLVGQLKFHGVREAADIMGTSLASLLPYLPTQTVVVPAPTTTKHVRQRGFDHTKLLAKAVARQTGLYYCQALGRLDQHRQFGTNAASRKVQLEHKMYVAKPKDIAGQNILLVDDVLTTGATLKEAARALRSAGAAHVAAAVFSQKVL